MIINTNVQALFAQNSLYQTQQSLQTLQQEMSTGRQINSPANNPSGLAISNLMQGALGGINSAVNNAKQGSNFLNVANGGMQTDLQIVQQIQQLAVQASNSTNNAQDTQDIQNQINTLMSSLDNVAKTVNYNNMFMLNGGANATANLTATSTIAGAVLGADSGNVKTGNYTVSVAYQNGSDVIQVTNSSGSVVANGTVANLQSASQATSLKLQLVNGQNTSTDKLGASFVVTVNQKDLVATSGSAMAALSITNGSGYQFQTGPNQSKADTLNVSLGTFNSATLGLNSVNVTNASSAQYAITQAQNALAMLTNAQGQVGANIDQINYTINNLQTESTNLQASRSTIMDANMAKVTSQFAQQQVLLQTGLQSLQTANSLPGMVLKLLG